MDINNCTDEELQKELNRRKRAAKKKAFPERLHIEDIGWSSVIDLSKENLTHISEKGFEEEDINQWMYEAVYEAVYGNKVFDWINKNTE